MCLIDCYDTMSQRVKLNIGGVRFETTVATLIADPESMLAKMMDQPNEKKWIDEGKELFIDRDGTHFAYVLNYLRDGETAAMPIANGHENIREWLIREANFYQLIGLGALVKNCGFKIGDIVKIRDEKAAQAYLLTVVYSYSPQKQCWVCCEKFEYDGIFNDINVLSAAFDILIGRIKKIDQNCAMVEFPYTCLFMAFRNHEWRDIDSNREIHIPLMWLRLA